MKLKKLKSKLKFSESTVYIFSELHKRKRAKEAMRFHELKIAVQVAVCIFVCQMLILIGLNLLGII
jgi:hypothetical protein